MPCEVSQALNSAWPSIKQLLYCLFQLFVHCSLLLDKTTTLLLVTICTLLLQAWSSSFKLDHCYSTDLYLLITLSVWIRNQYNIRLLLWCYLLFSVYSCQSWDVKAPRPTPSFPFNLKLNIIRQIIIKVIMIQYIDNGNEIMIIYLL